jgi:hypothetical protein
VAGTADALDGAGAVSGDLHGATCSLPLRVKVMSWGQKSVE